MFPKLCLHAACIKPLLLSHMNIISLHALYHHLYVSKIHLCVAPAITSIQPNRILLCATHCWVSRVHSWKGILRQICHPSKRGTYLINLNCTGHYSTESTTIPPTITWAMELYNHHTLKCAAVVLKGVALQLTTPLPCMTG